jgi:hypothetical protein
VTGRFPLLIVSQLNIIRLQSRGELLLMPCQVELVLIRRDEELLDLLFLQPALEGSSQLSIIRSEILTSGFNRRRCCVSPEQSVDNLIEAGWQVIDSDFDLTAFRRWRKQALDCVGILMGPAHPYTHYFRDFVEQGEEGSLLAGEGILVATKEQIAKAKRQAVGPTTS